MTDEDIISVLEKITKIESKDDAKNDTIYFMKGIFDLIKRQQAEIADLNTYIKQLDIEYRYELNHVVNDTIETFAEKLKESLTGWNTDPTDEEIEYVIDKLLKEMVGANNDR